MPTSLALVGKPVTMQQASLWQISSELCGILATAELCNMQLDGDTIKFDPVCFDGIDFRSVSAVVWYDSNREVTDTVRRVCDITEFSIEHNDRFITINPCFIFEGEHCPQQPEVDTMAMLCGDPCQRWADLEYLCLQAATGQMTSSLSADSKSQSFSKPDIELLRQKTEEAKAECLRCNPCFKPKLPRRHRCQPVGKYA